MSFRFEVHDMSLLDLSAAAPGDSSVNKANGRAYVRNIVVRLMVGVGRRLTMMRRM